MLNMSLPITDAVENTYWSDLRGDYDNIVSSCTNAVCDNNNLYWDSDNSVFDSAALFTTVNWVWQTNKATCAYFKSRYYGHDTSELKWQNCLGTNKAVCFFDCSLAFMCPSSHPFAFNGGSKCCKWYNKIDNTGVDAACDGGNLIPGDDTPEACCPLGEFVECPTGVCVDHTIAERHCPKQPSFRRKPNSDRGFLHVSNAWNIQTSSDHCENTYGAWLAFILDIEDFHILKELGEAGTTYVLPFARTWVALRKEEQPGGVWPDCADAGCNGLLKWKSGLSPTIDFTFIPGLPVTSSSHTSYKHLELRIYEMEADNAYIGKQEDLINYFYCETTCNYP